MEDNDETKNWTSSRSSTRVHDGNSKTRLGDIESELTDNSFTSGMIAAPAPAHQQMTVSCSKETYFGLYHQRQQDAYNMSVVQNEILHLYNDLNALKYKLSDSNLDHNSYQDYVRKIKSYEETLAEREETLRMYKAAIKCYPLPENLQLRTTENTHKSQNIRRRRRKRNRHNRRANKLKRRQNKVLQLNKVNQTNTVKCQYLAAQLALFSEGLKNKVNLGNQTFRNEAEMNILNEIMDRPQNIKNREELKKKDVKATSSTITETQKKELYTEMTCTDSINELEMELGKLNFSNTSIEVVNNYQEFRSEAMDCEQDIFPDGFSNI